MTAGSPSEKKIRLQARTDSIEVERRQSLRIVIAQPACAICV